MRITFILLLYFFNHFTSFGESVQHSHFNNSHTINVSHQSDFSFDDLYIDNSDDDFLDIQKKIQQQFYLPLFNAEFSNYFPVFPSAFSNHPKGPTQSLLHKICVLRL